MLRSHFAPPQFLPVYLWENVGPQGLLAVTLPAPFVPQSIMPLGPAALPQVLSAPAAHLCTSSNNQRKDNNNLKTKNNQN